VVAGQVGGAAWAAEALGPDLVLVGHACRDLVEGGFRLGGGVIYGGLVARNLGLRVGVVTSVGPDLDLRSALPGVCLAVRPSPASTIFHNAYRDKVRRQHLYSRALSLRAEDVPAAWRKARLVLLSPLAQEVPCDLGRLFPHALVGASVQGWLRRWDDSGHVEQVPWPFASSALVSVSVIVVGESDLVAEPRGIAALQSSLDFGKRSGGVSGTSPLSVPLVVVTRGEKGCTVHWNNETESFAAYSVSEVDPTGAGDAFAVAFLVEFQRTGDWRQAADFANCVASFVVEKPGVLGVPTLDTLEKRLGRKWGRT